MLITSCSSCKESQPHKSFLGSIKESVQHIKRRDYLPLLSSAETTSRLVCVALSSPMEIRHGHIRIVQSWATGIAKEIALSDK